MFEGFTLSMIDTGEAVIRVRHGGNGPPLLLLHGNPQTIHAICEDYRAAVSIDLAHEQADRDRRRIACPVLALWGRNGRLDSWYDVLSIWREWADDVRGQAIDSGHYLPEEAPDQVYEALHAFLVA